MTMLRILLLIACFAISACSITDTIDKEEIANMRQAAEQGDVLAQFKLGLMYHGGKDIPQDYTEAVKWYRKAAEQGFDEAQFILGVIYGHGKGAPFDNARAVKWYRKAAEQGHAKAQYNLGTMYANGKGVPVNYSEAYIWWSLAEANGDERAKTARTEFEKFLPHGQEAALQQEAARRFDDIRQRQTAE